MGGITMPSLNAQEAYAAAMAGFDTHKIAGHGALKRLQQQPGYSSPNSRKPIGNASLHNTPPHLQKSHTDGQLKLRSIGRNEEAESNEERRGGIIGSSSYSSIDSGADRSSSTVKHGSSEKELIHRMDSIGGGREAESENLLSNLTATFDEKLRLLLDPHYQSTGGGDPVPSNPTTDPPQPLVRNTPLKMDSNRQVGMPLKQQRSRSLQQHQNQAELAKD